MKKNETGTSLTYLNNVTCGQQNYLEAQQTNLKLILIVCVVTLCQDTCTENPGMKETKEAIYLKRDE